MPYPSFLEHLRSRYGRNWCVAPRASGKTAQYDVVLTPKKYEAERTAWASKHPVVLLIEGLPDSEEKTFIMEAVQWRLH